MKTSAAKFVGSLMRFASVFASLFIGMAFVAVTGAGAVLPDKKFEVKDKEKIVQFEKKDVEVKEDSRFFERKAFFNNDIRFVKPFFNKGLFFNRGLFFDRDVFFVEEEDD